MNEFEHKTLEERIAHLDSVSTAPVILQPLLEMLRLPSEKIRNDKLVEMVSRDPAIAAQCLRVANSPLFGHYRIETVPSAVMVLGIERMRSMLFGLCLHQTVPKEKWVLNSNAFWRHCLACALVTRNIASMIGHQELEKAYLAGLIHDIGFLANSLLFTAEFRQCLNLARSKHCALHLTEHRTLGFTHEESGRLLCLRWGFSSELLEVVGSHHSAEKLSSAGPLVCMVHLADLLCRLRNLGYGYEEILAVDLANDPVWKHLEAAYPALAEMDLVRFTLDLEGSMDEIAATVDSIFGVSAEGAALG